ncbi:MAG: SBBP repeat-containing protein [Candidatus Hodarchaeota archaeon]
MRRKSIFLIVIELVFFIFILINTNFNTTQITANSIKQIDDKNNFEIKNVSLSNYIPKLDWWEIWDNGDGDKGYDIAIDSEDNIYVVGVTDMGGNYNILIVKYNGSGIQLWNKTWDYNNFEKASTLTLDSSNNLYIVGRTGSNVNQYDVLLIKFNSTGDYEWNKTWGVNGNDYGYDVALDAEGNIYIVGETATGATDICLVKYNNSGDYEWNKTWGEGFNVDVGYGIAIDKSSDDIYITGRTGLYDTDGDVVLLKYNKTGDYEWNKTWGGVNKEIGYDIEFFSNKSIYIAGELNGDYLLMKYNSSGSLNWSLVSGGSYIESFTRLTVDLNETIYVTGYDGDAGGQNGVYSAKYNNTGDRLWEDVWDRFYIHGGEGIALDSIGNIYIAGWCTTPSSDLLLLKYANITNGGGNGDGDGIIVRINGDNDDGDSRIDERIIFIALIVSLIIIGFVSFLTVMYLRSPKTMLRSDKTILRSDKIKPKPKQKKSEKIVSKEYFNCPFCFKKIKMGEEVCSYCGTSIKMDE